MMQEQTWKERLEEWTCTQLGSAGWEQKLESFLTEEIEEAEKRGYDSARLESTLKVGMLRQFLNEDRITDPNKMVSNELLVYWLMAAKN